MNILNNPTNVNEANRTLLRVNKWTCLMFACISIINVPMIIEQFWSEILNQREIWTLVCSSLTVVATMVFSIFI